MAKRKETNSVFLAFFPPSKCPFVESVEALAACVREDAQDSARIVIAKRKLLSLVAALGPAGALYLALFGSSVTHMQRMNSDRPPSSVNKFNHNGLFV